MNRENNDPEYESFLSSEPIEPPEWLGRKILDRVNRELNPPHMLVFAKLVIIQGFIGALTLFFCPQFELSFTNNHSLFHFFHRNFGQNICMSLCGGIFLGSGAIFASFILSQAEVMKIKNSKLLYYLAMSSIFLTTFTVLGVEIYLEIAAFWMIGAIAIGAIAFGISSRMRSLVHSY